MLPCRWFFSPYFKLGEPLEQVSLLCPFVSWHSQFLVFGTLCSSNSSTKYLHSSVKASSLVLWGGKFFLGKITQIQTLMLANPLSITTWLWKCWLYIEMFVGIRSSGGFLNYLPAPRGAWFFQHFLQAPSRTGRRILPWLCPDCSWSLGGAAKIFTHEIWQVRLLISHHFTPKSARPGANYHQISFTRGWT